MKLLGELILFNKNDKLRYSIDLPGFLEKTMYKGMELNKEYTLKELGLWKYQIMQN